MVVAPSTSALPGGRFGAFRFIERIERNGPAELYRALWSEAPSPAERICLVKRLRPELASSPAFVRMFQDEARIMAKLCHPNMARVFQQGELEGLPYVATEPLDGLSLAELLAGLRSAGKKLPIEVAAYVASEVATALAYAHAASDATDRDGQPVPIVHRDLRPANVLLGPTGAVKLVEFGVARVASFVSQSMNATGAGMGRASYLSPEQVLGAPLDGRSDLFSLGVVLWEMLCGRALFPPTAPGEAAARLTGAPLERPSALRAEVPRALDELVMRLLERELPRRYPAAKLLVRDLEAFVPIRPDSVRAVASMVTVGFAGTPEAAASALQAAVAGAARAAAADKAAGRRPITRVVQPMARVAALLADPRVRALATRLPGQIHHQVRNQLRNGVRKVTGLVPVASSGVRQRAPEAPPAPPPPAPATRRSLFIQAAVVTVLAFLGGVLWHQLGATPPASAQAPAPRFAGVRIESLPPRPKLAPQAVMDPTLDPAGPHQGKGTAAIGARGRRRR